MKDLILWSDILKKNGCSLIYPDPQIGEHGKYNMGLLMEQNPMFNNSYFLFLKEMFDKPRPSGMKPTEVLPSFRAGIGYKKQNLDRKDHFVVTFMVETASTVVKESYLIEPGDNLHLREEGRDVCRRFWELLMNHLKYST